MFVERVPVGCDENAELRYCDHNAMDLLHIQKPTNEDSKWISHHCVFSTKVTDIEDTSLARNLSLLSGLAWMEKPAVCRKLYHKC